VTFFVVTILTISLYASDKLLNYFETRPQVIAFLKDDISSGDISFLQERLAQDMRVKDIKYVSKEEALAIYKEATTDNPLLAELVTPSIFPASLEFSLTDLNYAKDVIEEVKSEAVVDQVGFTANLGGEATLQNTVERLRLITKYVRLGGGVFVGIMLLASFTVLVVIISMRLTTRRGEIEILNLIGATVNFIRGPVIIEALTYVAVGVFLGWILAFIITLYLSPSLVAYFNQIEILPRNTINLFGLFGMILGSELVIGLTLALIGGFLAVSRSLKKK
jgi:cell division transport system permease protein